ncbi:type II toxin-antitoxin system VapC family toxin [candidate division KSB1 bacterium]|nr:type II toxin-antitoxin system VapC family toxin [candidate division KSB1 bacterium]
MNLLDSSGWLEYFADGPNAKKYSEPLDELEDLIVPTICLSEVFKVVLRERDEDSAIQAIALMKQGKVIELTSDIALQAAKNSSDLKLPIADSIILATAAKYEAIVWTQDADLKGKPFVKYFAQ